MAASSPQSSSSTIRPHSKLGLILLLMCSSFFALYHSNAAYTSDEVWSVNTVLSDNVISALKADVHPPFYFQLLDVWVSLFGPGERAVRSLSGLFYILAVLALYCLARELYGDELALLCAALYACSPLAIASAQFARMYALLSFLSIVSTLLYVQFWIKDRTNVWRSQLSSSLTSWERLLTSRSSSLCLDKSFFMWSISARDLRNLHSQSA
jgi:uncharacterized membrane protein